MNQSYLFLVNPNSNSGQTKKLWLNVYLPFIQAHFEKVGWCFTTKQGHGATLAAMACKYNYDVVVAVGGDGTINEVVNGLCGKLLLTQEENQMKTFDVIEGFRAEKKTPSTQKPTLGILPAGTGCDFIKTLGIEKDFAKSFEILKKGTRKKCDVGKVEFTLSNNPSQKDFRYFINIASAGTSGDVVQELNQSKKPLGSKFHFWMASVNSILKNKNHNVRIQYDEHAQFETNVQVIFVANGKYCGGGMLVAKEAKQDDGLFLINCIKKINPIRTVLLTPRLYSGNFLGLEPILEIKPAKKIRVEPNQDSDILVECDGEQPGILPAEFTFFENQIEIIC